MAPRPQPSDSYRLIWRTVRQIPKGRVATYGQVAGAAGLGGQARLVGYAMHALPEGSSVPWHRVLNFRGRISLPEADGQAALQRALLEAEGVLFRNGVVDLDRFRWRGAREP